MHLLALNLQRSSAINVAIYGNFSSPKAKEIVVAKGDTIELLRPDETGKLISICSTSAFSIIRSIIPFRTCGSNKDYVVIGSDSGKISVIEFDVTISDWKVVHCEVFGKTGCRRIVPGQYLAADPLGRAIMIASVEKQKFVYVMNRDSANRLTMSSPLEAHKAETILFSVVGVDVGYDNPVFAMIELEYTEADQDPSGEAVAEAEKKLTFYELDLGLNHVVRKWSEPIARTANLLLTVPGGEAGPSGVLICGENWISYKNQGHPEIRAAIPRRHDMPDVRGLLITTGTLHKQKDIFFFMVQSELGDLYKVTLEMDETNPKVVENLVITVFDSIPPANSLCITHTGLLFAASEMGNHCLFQFLGIGDDPHAVRSDWKRIGDELNEELGDDSISAARVASTFRPSEKLKNLSRTDNISSLAPITDMIIDDLVGEGSKQIYTLCGRGNRSSLKALRYGVAVTEMAVSELPGKATAVWTVRTSHDGEFDRFIIVSFSNATLVLSIGDNIEEVKDSEFKDNVQTLQVILLDDNAILQVHTLGIRHIRSNGRVQDWQTPDRRPITHTAVNSRQVVVSLEGGDIIYFELDATGTLIEGDTIEMGAEVSCLDLGTVPEGRAKSLFLVVGLYNDTVVLISLDQSDLYQQRNSYPVDHRPESLCLVHMTRERNANAAASTSSSSSSNKTAPVGTTLYLNIGLVSGELVRLVVDGVTGDFSDPRRRFLGPKPIKLFRVQVRGESAVLALSTRPWLFYNFQGRYYQAPISYECLEYACNFASEACPDGIVAVAENTLRIVTVDTLGEMFNQTTHPLRYTPRKMCKIPDTNDLIIIETDHNEYSEEEKKKVAAMHAHDMIADADSSSAVVKASKMSGGEEEEDEDEDEEGTTIETRSTLPPTEGIWASCIRIIDPSSGESKEVKELDNNQAALSVCTCRFTQHSEEVFVVVGVAKDMKLHPKSATSCSIQVYRLLESRLQLLHTTDVEDVPVCMSEFQGKLLVGIGKCLRLYELGKRKLLRKCENRLFPFTVAKLQCSGDRIYVGDVCESVHYVKYKRQENALVIFADDTAPRFITSLCTVDYDTVAASDKFGNFFVLRVPEGTNDDVDNPSGARLMWDHGLLNGAPSKASLVAHYYLGEAITSIVKCSFVPGGREVLVVSTIVGGIYTFVPLSSKEDVKFFRHVEMHMRQECPNLTQRDHLSYRSSFQPVKDVVDGDLCEKFGSMPYSKQQVLGDELDRTPAKILQKLEEMRNIL